MRINCSIQGVIFNLGADYMKKTNATTWEISARAETDCEGGTVVFYIYCCTQGFYACEFSART